MASLRTISLADATEMDSPSAMRGIGTGSGCPASTARATVMRYISSLSEVGESSVSPAEATVRCLGIPEHRTRMACGVKMPNPQWMWITPVG